MRQLILMFVIFFLTACTPKPVPQTRFARAIAPDPVVKSARVKVTITPNQLKNQPEYDEVFWTRARSQGMTEIGNAYIQHAPLVSGIDDPNQTLSCPELFTQSGTVAEIQDAQTGDYQQDVTFEAAFIPEKQMTGQILRLEQNRYIVSMKDRIVFRLFSSCPINPPAFFLVAQRIHNDNLTFLKIIGSGHVIDSIADNQPTPRYGPTGTLCLAELGQTTSEVEKGDIIFMLRVKAHAVARKTFAALPTGEASSEIIVEPSFEPEPDLPLETK